MKTYDAVIIGSGPGGSAVAFALADGGKKVALVEEGLWGGTCPNRGCDPKKMLFAGVEAVERTNMLAGKGFSPIDSIAWPELMAHKRSFTEPFPRSFKDGAEASGIECIEGSARFVDDNRIEVDGEQIEAGVFVVATGQRASLLDIEGKENLVTSTEFLDFDELPKSIAFLGAGYIAFELAAIANAAGSEVTIIHHNDRPLKGFDADLVSDLVDAYKARGVSFAFDVEVQSVTARDGRFAIAADGFDLTVECVVCATGRIPNVESLDLEKAHVSYGRRGIEVDEYLRTANESVFACGDVIDKKQPKLTPVASLEADCIAQCILGGKSANPMTYPPISSVIYGSPKLAQAGMSAEEAERDPDRYTVESVDMTTWFTYRRLGEPAARAKLVFEGDRLVGAASMSAQADELMNYLVWLMGDGGTKDRLDRMVFGYPTVASDLSSLR